MLTTAPRGTQDFLPGKVETWQDIESLIRELCRTYNYREIRTPIFEHTELFHRGIGDTTDIVEKEMYTFIDRGERSITLRPEGTAAAVRAFLENRLDKEPQPTKLYYMGPMFRYDRPQAGRYRQFHQFGVEAMGAAGPAVDAEIISLAVDTLNKAGLTGLTLYINSVGCPNCRPVYRQKLQDFLRGSLDELCGMCRDRFERNPLRILDCKNEKCVEAAQNAPNIVECLCGECDSHFEGLKTLLDTLGIQYAINPRLVRGLDYYTKTAFEIQYPPLGAQSAVCGGGRYDGLIEQVGGASTPGIGFAIGLERLVLAREKQLGEQRENRGIGVFFAPMGKQGVSIAASLLRKLRLQGTAADTDYLGRSLKAQMKYAAKLNARFVAIIGDEELLTNTVTLKCMQDGTQERVSHEALLAREF